MSNPSYEPTVKYHFKGSPKGTGVNIKLPPDEIKSNRLDEPGNTRPNIASYPWGTYKPRFEIGPDGRPYAITRTVYKKYYAPLDDFIENGPVFENDDYELRGMRAAGEDNYANKHDVISLPSKSAASGVAESLKERIAHFDIRDTPLRKYLHDIYVSEIHNNDVGKASSRIEKLRQSLGKYLSTRDGQELVSYLMSLGYPPEYIDLLADGFLPKGAIYGVARAKDGKIVLAAAEDAYEKIVRDSGFLGVGPEDLRKSALAEEIIHILRRSFDRPGSKIREEMTTKAIARDHYLKLAKGSEGDAQQKRKYEKLAAIKEFDRLTTRQRYKEKTPSYKNLYLSDRPSLELMLALDAMEMGYEGKDVDVYVANTIKEIAEGAEYRERNPQKSRLEQIAEKDSAADGREANPDSKDSQPPETSGE